MRLEQLIHEQLRLWVKQVDVQGRVMDPVERNRLSTRYGTLKLADAMLQGAKRNGDTEMAKAATRIVLHAAGARALEDPFNLTGVTGLISSGEQGRFPSEQWQLLRPVLFSWIRSLQPYSDPRHCLGREGCYDNWRMLWSSGLSQISSHHNFDDPRLGLSAVEQTIKGMAPAAAGPVVHTATGPARTLSDPPSNPPAYHIYTAYTMRVALDHYPALRRDPEVARLEGQIQRYLRAMMAPDGQMTWTGRSVMQSWTQAAVVSLAARRAAREPQWADIAQASLGYLLRYPRLSSGLLPIVPGLARGAQRKVMDGYAHQPEYSGLTLSMLTQALNHWTFDDPSAVKPAPDQVLFSDPLGSGLINIRRNGAWASLLARSTGLDARSAQGLRALKIRHRGAWVDLLGVPARDRLYATDIGWKLRRHESTDTAIIDRAVPTRSGATLYGAWAGGATLRARVGLAQGRAEVRILVPARTTLEHGYWPTPEAQLRAPRSLIHRRSCVITASGRACPVLVVSRNRSTRPKWIRVRFEIR